MTSISPTVGLTQNTLWYLCADNSLARPGRKRARKHVSDERDFNDIETRAVIKFFFLQGKAPNEIHAILTETLVCFLPGWAKDLSALLYYDRDCTDRLFSFRNVTVISKYWSRISGRGFKPLYHFLLITCLNITFFFLVLFALQNFSCCTLWQRKVP